MHEYEALSNGEEWLKKYTYDSVGMFPEPDVVQELLNLYPYEGGTLYRGLNFLSKEQWDAFLEKTENGTVLDTEAITSWAKGEGTARQFSTTRPSYFLDKQTSDAEIAKRTSHDYMIGHAGAILRISVPANAAIDVTKSRFGKEDEVILPAGRYHIELHQVLRPFMQSITEESYGSDLLAITSLGGDREARARFNHIIHRFGNYTDAMREHIFNLLMEDFPKLEIDVHRTDPKPSLHRGTGKMVEFYVGWNFPGDLIDQYQNFLPEHRAKVDQLLAEAAVTIDAKFHEVAHGMDWKHRNFVLMIDQSLRETIDSGKIKPKFTATVNAGIGTYYRHMNSREVSATITDRDAHWAHSKLIHHALSQMIRSPDAADVCKAKAAIEAVQAEAPKKAPPAP